MKKLLILALAVAALGACGKDNDDKGEDISAYNTMTIGTEEYDMWSGGMVYWGPTAPFNRIVTLYLGSDNYTHQVALVMSIPSSVDRLVTGTYSVSETAKSFGIIGSGYYIDGQDTGLSLSDGTVAVAASGNTYKVVIRCLFNDGQSFTGTYFGPLTWQDGRDNLE